VPGGRFCFITTFYPPFNFGGDGVGVQRLAQAIARRGHAVTVVHDADAYTVLARGVPPSGPSEDPYGVRVVTLRSVAPYVSTFLTHQTGRPVVNGHRLRRVLDEGDFDVIVFNNVSLVGGPGVLAYGRSDAVRLYIAHEHWLVCPTHVLWRHRRERCDARECVRCQLHHRRPPQIWRYTGLLERRLDHVDAFIAMSEFSRSKHEAFGFPREMDVLPYFVPDEDTPVESAADDTPHQRPYFLFVGRLEAIKGLDDVIPLFRSYTDADLVIAGEGTHGAALRALAGGAPNVKFIGRIEGRDLSRYYRHALALIVPSICYETFGIILIEAFRHGTPVLARRIGPLPEIVERSGGGEAFDDPDALRAAMQRLQANPDRRRQLGAAAALAVRQHWSEGAVVPRYLELINRVAREKGLTRVLAALSAEPATLQRELVTQ
jgi:glycosyltransferase involved in cell wall biosynthesis